MPAPPPEPQVVMTAADIRRAVSRLSREIAAGNAPPDSLLLVGIQTGGVSLARQLGRELEKRLHQPVALGELDVAMHRDDLDQRLAPVVHPTAMPADISGKTVILVDDVLFSGRTTRAALDALHDLGRPRRVQLAVLIDRGHRELPIQADYVGRQVATDSTDRIDVQLTEGDGVSQVVLEKTGVASLAP